MAARDTAANSVEVGFSPDLRTRLEATIQAGRVTDLHGLVVRRHGRIALEHYGAGVDFKWNVPLGRDAHQSSTEAALLDEVILPSIEV